MNIKLVRNKYTKDGVFGTIFGEDGQQIAVSLEHSYLYGTTLTAKVKHGEYTCLRHAPNRLPYETFELENVPDFQGKPVTGVLIHCGNFDKNSEGCILVGETVSGTMITNSKITFKTLMDLQIGVDSFTLTIE
jgi:Family of unknown function (DUF5675)